MTRRYLLVKVISERSLSEEQLQKALTETIRRYFGEIGLSRINPKLIRFDPEESIAVVGCRTTGIVELQAALALLSHVEDTSVMPLVLRRSGTIRSLARRRTK